VPEFTFDETELLRANDLARVGELTRSARDRRADPGQLPQIAQTYADLAERCVVGEPRRAELFALAATTWSLAGYQANAATVAGSYLREIVQADRTGGPASAAAAPQAVAELAAMILQRDTTSVARLGAAAETGAGAFGAALIAEAGASPLDDADATMIAVYGLAGRAARRLARFWRSGDPESGTQAIEDLRRACTLLLHAGVVDIWVLMDNLAFVVEDIVATSPWRLLRRAPGWNGLWRSYLRGLSAADRPVVQVWPSQQRVLDHGLLDRQNPNLTVTMPTSAGKTRIAEWAILEALAASTPFEEPLAVYIVPTRALAAQVERDLSQSLGPVGLRVSGLFGGFEQVGFEQHLVETTDVLVVTSEKFDLLMRNDAELGRRLALVVVDEGHLIGDPDRGLRLELVITRVRRDIKRARILLLSAVLPNGDDIAGWLDPDDRHLAEVDWSPSALRMGVFTWRGQEREGQQGVVEYRASDADPGFFVPYMLTRRIPKRSALFPKERKDIAAELAIHYQRLGPVLISVPRKVSIPSGATAVLAAANAAGINLGADESGAVSEQISSERANLVSVIEEYCGTGHELSQLVPHGIGYHHSDVPTEVRHGLERAYRSGAIRILCATSTLSQGVNLPTKTVIVSGTSLNRGSPLLVRDFRNTAGRAGRPFRESEGHVVIVATDEAEARRLKRQYLDNPQTEPVMSGLVQLYKALVEARLGAVNPQRIPDDLDLADPDDEKLEERSQILDLQLLASLAEEVVDTDDESILLNTVRSTLAGTLGGRQLEGFGGRTEPLTRFATRRIQAVKARVPDARLRAAYLRTGLSLPGCESARAAALRINAALDESQEITQPENWAQLRDIFVTEACTVPELSRQAEKMGVQIAAVPLLIADWMDGVRIDSLRDRHAPLMGIGDPMRFAIAVDRIVVQTSAWVLSAIVQLLTQHRENLEIDLPATLPAMAKYGVNSQAACFAASIGIRNRQDAIALGESCPPYATTSFRAFLRWALTPGSLDGIEGLAGETVARFSRRAEALATPREVVRFSATEEGHVSVPLRGIVPMQTASVIRSLSRQERLLLRRDRANDADANAIRVTTMNGQEIGYLAREYTRILAPMLDTEGIPPISAVLAPTPGPDRIEERDAVKVVVSIEPERSRTHRPRP
jgi:superfamily II DNA/RNA helicase